MRVEKIDLENFPTSESAQNMLATVTPGFYDKSYVGKWLYQVMGLEFDEAERLIAEELPLQFFPETATWGLMYHEVKWGLPVCDYLSYDERRKLIYEKRDQRAPMIPYRMEKVVKNSTGYDLRISDINDLLPGYPVGHPNSFVAILSGNGSVRDNDVVELLNRIKQSHTSFTLVHLIDSLVGKCSIGAGYHGTVQRVSAKVRGELKPKDHKAVTYAPVGCAAVRMQMAAHIKGDIRPEDHKATAPAPAGIAAYRQQIEIKIGGLNT